MDYVSPSQFNMWCRCPAQYEFRYARGLKVPPGIAARTGTAVHEPAEATARHKIARGEDLPVDYLVDMAATVYDEKVGEGVFIPRCDAATPQEQRVLLGKGKDAAARLTRLYRLEAAPVLKPMQTEDSIMVPVEGLEVPILCRLDLIEEDILDDLKTSSRSWSQADADSSAQLTLYELAFRHRYQKRPRIRVLNLVDLAAGPTLNVLLTSRIPQQTQRVIGRLQAMLKSIKAGLFPPAPVDAWVCSEKWCGYWRICPHGGK